MKTKSVFTNFIVSLLLLFSIVPVAQAAELDRYGGYTGIQGEKNGHWHLEVIHGRQWFITPEGNAFYVLGINHVTGLDDSEQEHALRNLSQWGFNTAGYDAQSWIREEMPHFVHVSLHDAIHWVPANRFAFVDVFSEAFADHVDQTIRKHCEAARDNPYTMGYSLTDTPRYDLDIIRKRRGTDWVSFIRQLDPDAAGKKRYVEFLRARYGTFSDFKTGYRLANIQSFDELYSYPFHTLELTRDAVRTDDEAFLVLIADRIYKLTSEAFDKYDPDAIVMSEKLKMHDHPVEILRLAAQYSDVISIQPGPSKGPDESEFDPSYWREIHAITGKPVFICDHACSFYTPEHPRTLWHQLDSEKDAARHYDIYLRQVAAERYMPGYQRCQYKSRYDDLRTLLKQGLLDLQGQPYDKLIEQVTSTNHYILKSVYQNE